MKRVLLRSGLVLIGALLGFEVAWFLGFLKPAASINPPTVADARESVDVTLAGTIDGSDRFSFTRESVTIHHGQWGAPKSVLFNGVPWPDLAQPPEGWAELGPQLDLPRATIGSREGRDIIALEPTAEGFDLYFADTQMGAGNYSVTISIPKK